VPPTTLKLPPELKERIQALVRESGESVHSFMLHAIEAETARTERQRDFLADAREARDEFQRTRIGYAAEVVHEYVRVRVAGKKAVRPKAKRWPR